MFWTSDLANNSTSLSVNGYVRYLVLLFFWIILGSSLSGQRERSNSIIQDTTRSQDIISIKKSFVPVPKKALLYSLVLPGAGQFYNRKYWKLPLVLGAYGGLIYALDFNTTGLKRWRTAYELRVDGDETTIDEFEGFLTDSAIRSRRDFFKKNLELTYMAAIVVHALNGIEAYVDAHLRNFDISEDLSFSVRPIMDESLMGSHSGIGIFVTF